MFKAFIMICLASLPDFCSEIEDSRGPYLDREACIERVAEMIEATKAFGPEYYTASYKYRCQKLDMIGT